MKIVGQAFHKGFLDNKSFCINKPFLPYNFSRGPWGFFNLNFSY